MMWAPVAETTTANYTFSHLQQQCNFVSTKKAGCHSSFAQKSVLDANCQFILRVAASLAMKQKTGVLQCRRFAEFSSHCC
jgi:hypothetical protein